MSPSSSVQIGFHATSELPCRTDSRVGFFSRLTPGRCEAGVSDDKDQALGPRQRNVHTVGAEKKINPPRRTLTIARTETQDDLWSLLSLKEIDRSYAGICFKFRSEQVDLYIVSRNRKDILARKTLDIFGAGTEFPLSPGCVPCVG
jgi:hypothetical protein